MCLSKYLHLALFAVATLGLCGEPNSEGVLSRDHPALQTFPQNDTWSRKLQMVTITPKIRGGTPCPVNRFPYMVSIRNRITFIHICGGILLNRFWILTAAHCLADAGRNPIVVAGTNLLDHGEQGEELFVTQSIVHPDYTGDPFGGSDIALMELSEPTTKVKVFANLPDDETKYGQGHELMAIGWGKNGNEVQDSLDCSRALQVLTQDRCQELWSETEPDLSITGSMMCAFDETSDTCRGDSGGPLIDAQSPGGKFSAGKARFDVIGGITSFGASCTEDNQLPGVYTFLPQFREWVLDNISKEKGENDQVEVPNAPKPVANVTAFLAAARAGDLETVESELANGVDIESRGSENRTALLLAANEGNVDILILLLDNGADIEAREGIGYTPLILATLNGHLETASALLERGADLEARGNEGAVSLFAAAQEGHLDVVKLLLDSGADVDAKFLKFGSTPLHIASQRGHVDVVQELIKRDADLEARSDEGTTPLFMAAENGHLGVVKLLLDSGAVVDAKFLKFGNTPLSIATFNGHVDVVEELVSRGADVNGADDTGITPLHRAAQDSGGFAIIALLVNAGASINAQTDIGLAPLHFAAENGQKVKVEKLLDLGADKSLMTQSGDTPGDNACICLTFIDPCCCNFNVCSNLKMDLLDLLG